MTGLTASRPRVEELELGGRETLTALAEECGSDHQALRRQAITTRAEVALLRAATSRREVRPLSGYTPDEASTQNDRWARYVQVAR